MYYKKYANAAVESFSKETDFCFPEGTFYHLLVDNIEHSLKELHLKTKKEYTKLIEYISKYDSYDKDGVLIQKSKVVDGIIDFNHHKISDVLSMKNMIENLINESLLKEPDLTMKPSIFNNLKQNIEKNYKQFLIDQKYDLVERIRVFAKNDGYDRDGVLVQTDLILKLVENEEKPKKSLKNKL